jgi:hypothetical protein
VLLRQLVLSGGFTARLCALYTALVIRMKHSPQLRTFRGLLAAGIFVLALCHKPALAQEPGQKPAEKPAVKPAEKSPAPEKIVNPAQIELLETKVRFESNGDSRKEVHTIVKINSEVGARQFARLTFDFNRSFETVEIPFVRITHAAGGTADILPSAITDQPNSAVVNAPAYQDVRVKSVRILGLAPGDTLEYRVVRTVSHHPLAPDFWLDHTFDRSGMVTREIFEVDWPTSRKPEFQINPATPASSSEKSGEGDAARVTYRWTRSATEAAKNPQASSKSSEDTEPDVVVSTEHEWERLSIQLDEKLIPGAKPLESIATYEESMRESERRYRVSREITAKSLDLTRASKTTRGKLEAIYDFVSQKIATIDLPLGATGFLARRAEDVLTSGYATAEDKFVLFAGLATGANLAAEAGLTGYCNQKGIPRYTALKHLLIRGGDSKGWLSWLDPSLEVAPFGLIPANSGKCILVLNRGFYSLSSTGHEWEPLDRKLPFEARQSVGVNASLSTDGKLNAKVHYAMRGDNELLLRLAFHQSPKEKWKELAQLLSITDGFRGEVSNVTASDPYATREPFTLDYEITMPKFVDWSKKTVRIPALLPQLGLPDLPGKTAPGSAAPAIDLGTPLEVETQMTLRLPPGTTVATPTGTSVERDYATYSSQYAAKDSSVTASRHIHFILREIPGSRAADYNAFVRAVQSDAAQIFTLERAATASAAKKE